LKLISKKYWQDTETFIEQISIKTELCCRQAYQNIGENSHISQYSKVKYRPILSVECLILTPTLTPALKCNLQIKYVQMILLIAFFLKLIYWNGFRHSFICQGTSTRARMESVAAARTRLHFQSFGTTMKQMHNLCTHSIRRAEWIV